MTELETFGALSSLLARLAILVLELSVLELNEYAHVHMCIGLLGVFQRVFLPSFSAFFSTSF